MLQVAVREAKNHLSRLLAAVERGEDVVILRGRVPVARLVAFDQSAPRRPAGSLRGRIDAPAEAFAPMSEAELDAWGL